MKKINPIFILFFLAFTAQFSYAQQSSGQTSYSISGSIVDAQSGVPLEYTTVSLHRKADSSLVTGNVTDVQGNFEIQAPAGSYWVEVQFISYATKIINDINLGESNPNENLGKITLAPDTKTLSEVVVSGEKAQMEMSLDKRTFNVASDLTNAGRNAAEILDNVPSVTVDVDGNVSLRGSQNVRILVDGKPSGLVGISSTDALRMLQGDLIERVEVITNPSARYEAAGMAGIINIILKKEKRTGLNGSFTVNAGQPANYGVSLNLNVRKNRFNLFTSYGISYRENPGKGFTFQEFYLPEGNYFTNSTNDRLRTGLSNNFRMGSDFYLNDHNTITVSGLYRVSDQENNAEIRYTDLNSDREVVQRTLRQDEEGEDESNMEYNLNYTRTFSKEGQKLTADIQYREGGETERSQLVESIENSLEEYQPEQYQRSVNDEYDNNFLMQADYIHPFGKDGKIEAGYRGSIRKIETDYVVDTLSENNVWQSLSEFTNNFNYDENIYAAYGILGNKINRFSYQLGLRAEFTDITTELETNNEKSDKDYFNLFPSAHLTYSLKKDNSLQVSYSRRINRPGFWDLNPFTSFSDDRNIRSGNPDLDPELTSSYEMGYLKNWGKASLYSGIYYRHTLDVVQRISTFLAEDSITFSRPLNLGTMNAYGIETNLSKDISNWWQISGNANFYRAVTEGEAFGEDLSSDAYTMSGRFSSKITFWRALNYQLSAFYRAPEETPQGRRKAMYAVDMALSKDVFKGKGTLTLSVSDLFNTRKYRGETFGSNFYSNSQFQRSRTQFLLSFSYRLNQVNRSQGRNNNNNEEGGGGEDMGDF